MTTALSKVEQGKDWILEALLGRLAAKITWHIFHV
jgi:hypothetical protein